MNLALHSSRATKVTAILTMATMLLTFGAISSSGAVAPTSRQSTQTRSSGLSIPALAVTAGMFHAVPPARILDTRRSLAAPGPIAAGATISVQIFGSGRVPGQNVSAVAVNLTVTAPTRSGEITAYPDGQAGPVTSNLNFLPGQTVANFAIIRVGANGRIRIANHSTGTVQVIADVSGYYLGGTPVTAGAFQGLPPARVLDSRTSLGATGPVPAGTSVAVQIQGRGGIPSHAVSAVAINLTATAPVAPGNITAYPDGQGRPATSNVNFLPGQTVANFAIVPVGADGNIRIFNSSPGTVQIVGDISGYYLAGSATVAGAFRAVSPARLLDSRIDIGTTGPIYPYGDVAVQVNGRGGIPTNGVAAVAINLTITGPLGAGNVVAYPSQVAKPVTSTVNFLPAQTIPNFTIVPIGPDGKIRLANNSPADLQLIADISGYFLGAPTTTPAAASFTGHAIHEDFDPPTPLEAIFISSGGVRYIATTDAAGSYSINLPPGAYTVDCGFGPASIPYFTYCDFEGDNGPGPVIVRTPPRGQTLNIFSCATEAVTNCIRP